jgi:hypothetical protein
LTVPSTETRPLEGSLPLAVAGSLTNSQSEGLSPSFTAGRRSVAVNFTRGYDLFMELIVGCAQFSGLIFGDAIAQILRGLVLR